MKKTLQQAAFFPAQTQEPEVFLMEDAPCNKTLERGTSALTNSEVLAAIIGANSATSLVLAKKIMNRYNNSFTAIAKASISELKKMEGVTGIIAARIACTFEINRRRSNESINDTQVFRSSGDFAHYFKNLIGDEPVEFFYAAFLNRANKLLKIQQISKGGLTGTVADPRVILKAALEHNATSIVLCHNHPSGSLKPSRADEELTMKIRQAAQFMDIKVMDHLIVSTDGYFSFADEGLL